MPTHFITVCDNDLLYSDNSGVMFTKFTLHIFLKLFILYVLQQGKMLQHFVMWYYFLYLIIIRSDECNKKFEELFIHLIKQVFLNSLF